MSANDISAEGAKVLASLLRKKNCALIELNLGYNRLNSEGIQHLAKALRPTRVSDLAWENNLDNQASKSVRSCHRTSLYQTERESCTVRQVRGIRSDRERSESEHDIAIIDFTDVSLDLAVLVPLRLLKTNEKSAVVDIDVHFNKIGVLGAQEIGSMLAVNEKIKKLNLQYNNIGVEGASHIAKGLETNKTLSSLDISYNTIKDDGAKLIYKLIQNSEVLQSVNLEENFIHKREDKTSNWLDISV